VRLQQYLDELNAKSGQETVLGLYVADAETGKELFSSNGTHLFIPASVLKIITTFAALKALGGAYRFPTEVFIDHLPHEQDVRLDTSVGLDEKRKEPWKAGNLYLRGYGDPSFVSEQLFELAQGIKARGVDQVEHVVIDDSLFKDPPRASGPRPYQAALSATSLNSNCYTVTIAPGASGAPAFVSLGPGTPFRLRNQVRARRGSGKDLQISQVPFSASFVPGVNQEKLGLFTVLEGSKVLVDVRGTIGLDGDAEIRYLTVPDPPGYFGALLKFMLEKAGVAVSGKILLGQTPAPAKQLLLYESKALAEILRDLNHYSSNYLAGQIVFAMGQDDSGRFRYELGVSRLKKVLNDLGYEDDKFNIVDGSGLSRENKLTPEQIVKVLAAAYRDFSVAPDLIASFSRFGHTGTLKKRNLLPEKDAASVPTTVYLRERQLASGVWGKTGTLDGVSSLAGFLESRGGARLAFAVVANGPEGKALATETEDDLTKILLFTE